MVTNEEIKQQLDEIDSKIESKDGYIKEIFQKNIDLVADEELEIEIGDESIPNLKKIFNQFEGVIEDIVSGILKDFDFEGGGGSIDLGDLELFVNERIADAISNIEIPTVNIEEINSYITSTVVTKIGEAPYLDEQQVETIVAAAVNSALDSYVPPIEIDEEDLVLKINARVDEKLEDINITLDEALVEQKVDDFISSMDIVESVRILEQINFSTLRYENIGVAGEVGFGMGDMNNIPDGFVRKMTGNYVDESGSWMCYFPIAKVRIGHEDSPMFDIYGANTVEIKNLTASERTAYHKKAFTDDSDYELDDGYMIPICFVDDGEFLDGVLFDKYKGGFEAGILKSKLGIQPIHSGTDAAHGDRFSDVLVSGVSAGANRYDTAYKVVKSRGEEYCVPENAFYTYLSLLSLCQRQNATTSAKVAWMDKAPFAPKGNNNSLRDVDDSSVLYKQAKGSNSGKSTTGAIENFEKTTHDGSILGVADLNGGMWEIVSGFTRTTALGFLTRKRDFKLSDLTPESAFDVEKFNPVNVGAVISGNDGWISFGNADNAVFDNDIANIQKLFNGIPRADGVSANGTDLFGKDGLNRHLAHELVPIRAGSWTHTSRAGVFAMNLLNGRSTSGTHVGVRALKCVYGESL